MTKILHDKRFIWALFILIALGIFLSYLFTSIQSGQGNLLMPLDDVYIHFQYAKQMATGHPYHYNTIDPATSGATSFIYPYILAFAYLLNFRGLCLGLWAMLIGTVALIAAMWAVYRLCKALDVPQWLSVLTAVSFALTGSVAWHFMSGMETGLMMALTLWTLLYVIEKRFRSFIVIATLLSLTRPEGGLLALLASGTMFLRLWLDFGAQGKHSKRIQLLLLIVPVIAIGIQPLVNLLITGTTVATGNQAKSILSTVPQDWGLIISRIVDNFLRMWGEFITGYDGLEGRGWYLPLFTGLLGLAAIPMLLFKKNYRLVGLMLLGWFLAMTAAISTLDTAFWHFKRYQMPMIALFFPLAAWVISWLIKSIGARPALPIYKVRYFIYLYPFVIIPIFSIALFFQFLHYHALNVSYVYQQPYQMALWLRENTPEESIVAVHDVGLMRYMGERNTLDIVGLTTANAAAYWRNGPGSVAEFLINNQPDYIASYGRGHGYGLAYLADTSLYKNELAAFPIKDWQPYLNVALAADFQGIYQPDWSLGHIALQVTEYHEYEFILHNANTYYFLNVADIASENQYDYQWSNVSELHGFQTEVREFCYVYTRITSTCFDDSYRLIDGYEVFIFPDLNPELDAILTTRIHPANHGSLEIYINDEYFATRVIPEIPGRWLDIPTLIPAESVTSTMTIRIIPKVENGYYMPAFHRIIQGEYIELQLDSEPQASFQDGSMMLLNATLLGYHPRLSYQVLFEWASDGAAQGDYRLFIHVYDDVNQPPLVQRDLYLNGASMWGYGSQTLGNLLPGSFSDTIGLGQAADLAPGPYQLAIGFYNPQNPQDRLMPESDVYEVSPDGRLWIGKITIDSE